jgi:hypothetical protein
MFFSLSQAAAKSTISASDSDTLSTLIKTNLLARRVLTNKKEKKQVVSYK